MVNPLPDLNNRKEIGRDLLASLVVFLVALPLCMGIAIASGAPVAAGLVTGIVGGLVVGFFSGAPLQVSGPAAGLTVICGDVISQHGLPAFGVVVMWAGIMQLVAGVFKLGQWFRAVSPAVVHGMLSGIGVLILCSQFHVMVDDRPRQGGLENLLSLPEAIQKGLPIPRWENREQRQARLAMLQTFGQLHEHQAEIAAHVGRLVTVNLPDEPSAEEAEQLKPFIPLQQSVLTKLLAARDEPDAISVGNLDGGDGASLSVSIQQTRRVLGGALGDLESGSIKKAARSQEQAAASLAEVLAGLKNHDWAAKLGLTSIAIIILWQSLSPKWLRFIPGPLLAVVLVTVLAWAGSLPVLYVEVPDRLIDGLTLPALHVLTDVPLKDLLAASLFMAVIASAETLLCATAVDRMHGGPRAHYDRELAAQGLGNIICGSVGALPMTGVIVRSAANVQAGGRSRLSSILHGLWLLIFVVALGSLLRMIPTAALAGILVYTGFKLIDFKGFFELWKTSKSEAAILLITVIVIVVEDLLMGVVTGIVLSAIKLLITFAHLDVQLSGVSGKQGHERVTLTMSGAATFLRLPLLADKLDEVPAGAQLHIDFGQLEYIDHACLELLMDWAKQHEAAGGRLIIDWGQLHARFRDVGGTRRAFRESVKLRQTT